MSLAKAEDGRAVHIPANPNLFQFDDEVAKIFPDMAKRSIPLYHESHRAHVAMLHPLLDLDGVRVLDVAASRGAFLQHIINAYGYERVANRSIDYQAIDNSPKMVELMSADYPYADVRIMDVLSEEFAQMPGGYDIICAYYILQFLPRADQVTVLELMAEKLNPGGCLIIGQKSASDGKLGEWAHEEYIRFRIQNGYTREEIVAKTKALAGSMFPMDFDNLIGILDQHFTEVVETSRWMMFNTLIARK